MFTIINYTLHATMILICQNPNKIQFCKYMYVLDTYVCMYTHVSTNCILLQYILYMNDF